MSVLGPITAAKPERVAPADGHQWRSELLDEFARLEAATQAKCYEFGLSVATKATLAQRLGALRKLDLVRSDEARAKLDECLALVEVRNDVVHAKLHMVMLPADDGGPTFLFYKPDLPVHDGNDPCRMVNEAGFKTLQSRVKQCREHIKQLRAQAPTAPASASG